MLEIISVVVGFFASIVGAIAGIGGGIIIKPVLDLLGMMPVSTINFLSTCTVLSMSCYSLINNTIQKKNNVDINSIVYLAIGSIIGGVSGKSLFNIIKNSAENPQLVSNLQTIGLALITVFTLVYIVNKKRIKTLTVKSKGVDVCIGLTLGLVSSFLGIGGGPINIVVLMHFYSMDSKQAAISSLYIIFFSQISNLLTTVFSNSIPTFKVSVLVLMTISAILGGIVGRKISSKIDNDAIDKLLIVVMILIIIICGITLFK